MQLQATVAHQPFLLDKESIEKALSDQIPEPLREHFVIVGGRRFPPKQVVAVATGLDRGDFTTFQARSILARLGFSVGRRSSPATTSGAGQYRPGPHGGKEADLLRPFAGSWVAQRGLEVLVAADAPETVVSWLQRHNLQADVVFRVPEGAEEADILAQQ